MDNGTSHYACESELLLINEIKARLIFIGGILKPDQAV